MKNENSLMTFPCEFQIKIIGIHKESLEMEMLSIARKHFPDTKEASVRSKPSQQRNYLSITMTLFVQDQKTLDSLYLELTNHPDIKWVL